MAYTLLGAAWIVLGDFLVRLLAAEGAQSQRYQTFEEGGFVLLSAGFVYWLTRRARQSWVASNAELLASRHQLETAVRVAGVGYWTVDKPTAEVSWSAEMYPIFGMDPEDRLPALDDLMERIHADDRASFAAEWAALERHGAGVLNHTHRIVRPDGKIRWVRLRGEHVREPDGSERVLGTMLDITDVKSAEADLRFAQKRLATLAGYLEGAREEERRRLAMDIHDDIGAGLAGIRMSLALLERGGAVSEAQSSRVRALDRDLEAIIGKVRGLAANLRPVELDELGLMAALTGLAVEWRQNSPCQLDIVMPDGDPPGLSPERGIHVYRIVQEALTNVSRHAAAQRVLLAVTERNGGLDLLVEDDGIGPGSALRSGSFGILNMQHRAELLGGTLKIGPGDAGGTSVRLRIPLARGSREAAP